MTFIAEYANVDILCLRLKALAIYTSAQQKTKFGAISMLAIFQFNGKGIRFEQRGDRDRVWVSLTDMAKASGKKVHDWSRLDSTTEFLQELESVAGIPVMYQCDTKSKQGTWGIEEVAIDFAAWCSIPFRIWMLQQIKELLVGGKVELRSQPIQQAIAEFLEAKI